MECKELLPLLYDYIDEDISVEDKKVLELHLKQCTVCRRELESIKASEIFFKQEFSVPLSVERQQKITEVLQHRLQFKLGWLVTAAMALFALTVGLIYGLPKWASGNLLVSLFNPYLLIKVSRDFDAENLLAAVWQVFDFGAKLLQHIPLPSRDVGLVIALLITIQAIGSYMLLKKDLMER
ncbi:MAG: zf-HC2 domain-containing protein [Blastocatellia bacterium]|nr:zf-HC2 domain-containing protein [Blastocatellia bacterium]